MRDRVHPETVEVLLEMLIDELRLRGLSAEPFGANMLWIRVCQPSDAGPRATLICLPGEDGRPGWWWLRTRSGGALEYEWLCAAVQTATAADAVARELAQPERGM